MKVITKHTICLSVLALIFIIGSCHKDKPHSSQSNTTNTDSIHSVDSINKIVDSAIGTYWCQNRHTYLDAYSHRNIDTLLGYDSVVVKHGSSFDQILVNGTTLIYQPMPDYMTFSHWLPSGAFVEGDFYNNFDSIVYVYYYETSPAGNNFKFYAGHKIR